MRGLFDLETPQQEMLALPDAEIEFTRAFLSPELAKNFFERLLSQTVWREQDVYVWGKWHKQPRLVAWYGDPGAAYTYSGATLQPEAWTPTLFDLRSRIESATEARFNSVLLNLYRDHRDGMGWHSDDERELGDKPTIASLSLGATRIFQLKHKTRRDVTVRRVELTAGSLLIMRGCTQQFWSHGVRKEARAAGPRINLTFRYIQPGSRK